jgi:uncharacterized protein YdaU (DUF1376 family)
LSKMPWVRFFPSDWLGGTRGMSAVETGIYITLIATMYERGEPIPEDHGRLSRLCGASNSAFKKALDALVDEGKITRVDGGLWNDRVEKEQVYLSEKSEVGSRAANARWRKKDNKNNEDEYADALPTQSPGNANQKPEARTISSSLRSEDSILIEFENEFWPNFPRKTSKGAALKAYKAARKKTSFNEIMAGCRRYASDRHGEDHAFTKHPATWLNGLCWLDEPAPVSNRGQAPPGRPPSITDVLKQQVLEMQADGRENPESDGNGETDGAGQALLGLAYSSR